MKSEMTNAERARTSTEKDFKAAMRKIGWHVYRDEESGRLVTNLYRCEVSDLSKKIGMALEVVGNQGTMVKTSCVEPATL